MKFLCVLFLASLATTSLAVLNGKSGFHQPPAVPWAAQFIISNLQISNEDLSKEPSISREELISKEQIVIRSSKRPQNQNPKLPLSILKEKHLRNAALGSEETTEHTPCAASTTEGKLMELGHKIISNLENTVKETIKYLKSLFSHASEVVKP
uniref:Glycosylation-dependent cell adhesion molecule 1 n=1 Tax=Moschus moschiferus TaxID=68415 RepID=A0A8C6FJY0_MOSMO